MQHAKPAICQICGSDAHEAPCTASELLGTYSMYECERCGYYLIEYRVSATIADNSGTLGEVGGRRRANLSALIRSLQSLRPTGPRLSYSFYFPKDEDELRVAFDSIRALRFHEMADKLLVAFEKHSEHAGKEIKLEGRFPEWCASAWACNEEELVEILEYLDSTNRIKLTKVTRVGPQTGIIKKAKILPDGWKRLEEIAKERPDSEQGFVAMPFSDELKKLYEDGIEPAIYLAGYRPLHIGRQDDLGRIDAQIEVEIQRSKFVVADLTGENTGAVYEAGYARGHGVHTILTRQKTELESKPKSGPEPVPVPEPEPEPDKKKPHFDIRQIRTLTWEDLDDLADFVEKLSYRIQLNCGKGPVRPSQEKLAKFVELYPELFKSGS